jgi:hypothetical protein
MIRSGFLDTYSTIKQIAGECGAKQVIMRRRRAAFLLRTSYE